MYGLGRQSGNNEDTFDQHQYLFSQSDHIMSNSALLTPDPDPRFIKFPDSAFNDYTNLGGFVDNSGSGNSNVQFISNDINPTPSGHLQLPGDAQMTDYSPHEIYTMEQGSLKDASPITHMNEKASSTNRFPSSPHTSVGHPSPQSSSYRKHYNGFKATPFGSQNQELKLSGVLVP
jgi:hypothetical protein